MKKLLLCSLALVMIVLAIAGCGKSTSSSSATTKELTFNGETYTVPKDPQRIAVLSNSVLSMLYAVDGKAISRASTTDKLAPELEALPALGQTANINMEQLLGLKPDVVLGLENQHKKYESQLQSNPLLPPMKVIFKRLRMPLKTNNLHVLPYCVLPVKV